jgi:hypothetical protein
MLMFLDMSRRGSDGTVEGGWECEEEEVGKVEEEMKKRIME